MSVIKRPIYLQVAEAPVEEIVHEDNDWGISLVEEESTEVEVANKSTESELVEGLQVIFV